MLVAGIWLSIFVAPQLAEAGSLRPSQAWLFNNATGETCLEYYHGWEMKDIARSTHWALGDVASAVMEDGASSMAILPTGSPQEVIGSVFGWTGFFSPGTPIPDDLTKTWVPFRLEMQPGLLIENNKPTSIEGAFYDDIVVESAYVDSGNWLTINDEEIKNLFIQHELRFNFTLEDVPFINVEVSVSRKQTLGTSHRNKMGVAGWIANMDAPTLEVTLYRVENREGSWPLFYKVWVASAEGEGASVVFEQPSGLGGLPDGLYQLQIRTTYRQSVDTDHLNWYPGSGIGNEFGYKDLYKEPFTVYFSLSESVAQ